jgi:hypothetical protein
MGAFYLFSCALSKEQIAALCAVGPEHCISVKGEAKSQDWLSSTLSSIMTAISDASASASAAAASASGSSSAAGSAPAPGSGSAPSVSAATEKALREALRCVVAAYHPKNVEHNGSVSVDSSWLFNPNGNTPASPFAFVRPLMQVLDVCCSPSARRHNQ